MKDRLIPLSLAALFLVLGSFVLDLPGIQTDEALFASVLYSPKVPPVTVRLIFADVPAMCFPYIGSLKTSIYALVWRFFEPSAASVHFPVVVLGAISIYIFARLLQRLKQPLWAAVLLATDATYLMTIRSDWGPVALQHLLAISGAYCGVRYSEAKRLPWAAAAGFLFGLGFWDKITFLWILFALAAGVLVTARHLIRPLPVAVLTVFFLLGCYPLLVYNYKTGGNSFRGNAALDTGQPWLKAFQIWHSLGDFNIFGAGTERALPPVEPEGAVARFVTRHDYTFPLMPWLFGASLLAAPWLWRSMYYRFYLTALIAGYGYMFSLKNAGSGAHHIVLLWPLPHLLAGSLPLRRWMVAVVAAANLLQINHNYAQFLRREVGIEWSDASAQLAQRLKNDPRAYGTLDWGIIDNLYLLTAGRLDLYAGPGPDRRYISHVPERMIFPTDVKTIPEETIADSAGRPVYVISRGAPVEGK